MKGLYAFTIIVMLSFVLLGCAAVKKSIDYYSLCRNDTACYAQMEANRNITTTVFHSVGDSANITDILSCIAGNIASGLTGILLGRKLKRRG